MSVFRTLAAGSFDGTVPSIVAATMISAIARTNAVANGSWDLTMEKPMPTGKVVVKVQAHHIAVHNLSPDYDWVNVAADGSSDTLRVTLRNDLAALTDAAFDVEVKRVAP